MPLCCNLLGSPVKQSPRRLLDSDFEVSRLDLMKMKSSVKGTLYQGEEKGECLERMVSARSM